MSLCVKYIITSGPTGAICTTEMKKLPRFAFQEPDDIHLFGFTANEANRIADFEYRNPELFLEWLLRDRGITKSETFDRLREAGIALPMLYQIGFKNNNCLGCVKATSPQYWAQTRLNFPETFASRARRSRELGVKLVRLHGTRIFLDELPPDLFGPITESISCGPECGTVVGQLETAMETS